MDTQHKNLAAGHWRELSLAEQLGNIGSEIHRAMMRQKTGGQDYSNAIDRALELLNLTIQDPRWKMRLKEITRAKELLGDAIYGGKEYGSTLENLDKYFFIFALAARIKK